MKMNENSMNDDEILPLDFDEKEEQTRKSYLVGWNDEKNVEVKYEVNSESLLSLSVFAKTSVDTDQEHDRVFHVKGGTRKDVDNKLASATIVKKICDWVNHYSESLNPSIIVKPIRSSKFEVVLKKALESKQLSKEDEDAEIKWNMDFFNMDKKEVLKLTLAANHMDMSHASYIDKTKEGLLNTCCAFVATAIKGLAPDDIRRMIEGTLVETTDNQ